MNWLVYWNFFGNSKLISPFLYKELYNITYLLMEKIEVPDILRKATCLNTIKLTEIKLGIDNKKRTYRTSNVLDLKVFVLDFATEKSLKKTKKVNNITEKMFHDLKDKMVWCIIRIIEKPHRSPQQKLSLTKKPPKILKISHGLFDEF